jgi:hypothetical protein
MQDRLGELLCIMSHDVIFERLVSERSMRGTPLHDRKLRHIEMCRDLHHRPKTLKTRFMKVDGPSSRRPPDHLSRRN